MELARHRKFLELLDERDAVAMRVTRAMPHGPERTASRAIATDAGIAGAGAGGITRWNPARSFACAYSVPYSGGCDGMVALGFVAARYTRRISVACARRWRRRCFRACARWSRTLPVRCRSRSMNAPPCCVRHFPGSADSELLVSGVTDGSNPNVRLQSIRFCMTTRREAAPIPNSASGLAGRSSA